VTMASQDDRSVPWRHKLVLWLGLLLVVCGLLVSFAAAYQAMPALLRIGLGACVLGSAVILGGLGLVAARLARRSEDREGES